MQDKNIDIRLCDNLELMTELPDNHIDLIYSDILYGTGSRKITDYTDLKPKKRVIEEHYVPRLTEMYRLLSKTGSIYLQMDQTINHWIRCILEDIGFHFQSEIIWELKLGNNSQKNNWQNKHDTILFFTKSRVGYKWNDMRGDVTPAMLRKYCNVEDDGRRYMVSYGKKYYLKGGKKLGNVWDIPQLSVKSTERTGYDTQKPKELIERILTASTDVGDTVADFYLGSGTTAEVCMDMGRRFIGCDISEKAIQLSKTRCKIKY